MTKTKVTTVLLKQTHIVWLVSFMILAPAACALEFKERVGSRRFDTLYLSVSFIQVFMLWCIYAGFVPSEYNGLIQRAWAVERIILVYGLPL